MQASPPRSTPPTPLREARGNASIPGLRVEQAGAQEIIVWMPDAKDLEPIKLFARECLQK